MLEQASPLQKDVARMCVPLPGEQFLSSPSRTGGGADTLRRGGVQPPLQCRPRVAPPTEEPGTI